MYFYGAIKLPFSMIFHLLLKLSYSLGPPSLGKSLCSFLTTGHLTIILRSLSLCLLRCICGGHFNKQKVWLLNKKTSSEQLHQL